MLRDIWEQRSVPLLKMHNVASSQLAFQASARVGWARKVKRFPALTERGGSSRRCSVQAWPDRARTHFNRI